MMKCENYIRQIPTPMRSTWGCLRTKQQEQLKPNTSRTTSAECKMLSLRNVNRWKTLQIETIWFMAKSISAAIILLLICWHSFEQHKKNIFGLTRERRNLTCTRTFVNWSFCDLSFFLLIAKFLSFEWFCFVLSIL